MARGEHIEQYYREKAEAAANQPAVDAESRRYAELEELRARIEKIEKKLGIKPPPKPRRKRCLTCKKLECECL